MSAIVYGRVFWTVFPELSYTAKNGKAIKIKETTAKIVMLAIADSADDFGENSWNSFQTLATKTSIQRRSVIRVVRALINNDMIKVAGITKYGTNNFSINLNLLGDPPRKRAKAGRPKTSDSDAETSDPVTQTSDSEAKTSDSQSPDPLINPPVNPPLIPQPREISFDEEKADIGWMIAGGKKVTQKQLDKQWAMKDFEEMLEVQFKRFPLNWLAFDEKAKENFRRFIKALPQGESLEKFVDWWMSDEKRVSVPPYTLAIVMQRWPQAFVKKTNEQRPEQKIDGVQARPDTPFTRALDEGWTYTPRKTMADILAERKQSEQLKDND